MKKLIVILVLLLVTAAAAIWYLKFAGVTHEDICEAVTDESMKIQFVVDDRYQKLDQKLERIEGKLDKILEIATPPPSDCLQKVK